MHLSPAPRQATYDVVVIGSGLGGLTAAALCAARGMQVLVVEQAERTGGYAQGFRRGPYSFDAGLHGTSFGWIEPRLPTILNRLGVGDRVRFAPCGDPLYSVFLPDFRFDAPTGAEEFVASNTQRFPDDARAFEQLYRDMQGITEELVRPRPQGSLDSLSAAEGQFDLLLRYRSMTLHEAFETHGFTERFRAVFAGSWPLLGDPPLHISLVAFAAMLVVRAGTGEHYCLGTFQSLVDALTDAVLRHDGEIVVGTEAGRIVVDEGRVAAVELADGTTVGTGAVVANADAHQTFFELVGEEHLPENFARRVARLQPSLSALVVYAATALPREAVDLPHVCFVHDSWDHEESYKRMQAGEPASLMLSVPSLTDPSLAPEGEQTVHCVALVEPGTEAEWAANKDRRVNVVLDRIESVMPGFRKNLRFVEAATPVDLARLARNHRGAVYGYSNAPASVGSKRPSTDTPVEGLYLASQWTQPGSGSLGAIYAGVRAANLVAGEAAEHLGAAV